MLDYIPLNQQFIDDIEMHEANMIIFTKSDYTRQLLKWSVFIMFVYRFQNFNIIEFYKCHLGNNETIDKSNRLYKISSFIEIINLTC